MGAACSCDTLAGRVVFIPRLPDLPAPSGPVPPFVARAREALDVGKRYVWLEDALQVLVSAKLRQGPRVASLSPVILVTSGNKEAVVGGFMGIVIVPL
jgi:hypothetical protein